jgi:hypothetical protein
MMAILPTVRFEHSSFDDDLILKLVTGTGPTLRVIPVSEWISKAPHASAALSTVFGESEVDGSPEIVVSEGDIRLSSRFVASLNGSDAAVLGLPPATPLALDLASHGLIPDNDFQVTVRWIRPGGSPIRAEVKGAIIDSASGPRRIPEPLYSIWRAARRLEQPLPEGERYEAIAELNAAMPDDARAAVSANAYLADTRIYYATSVSLSLGRSDAFDFDPVLFSERAQFNADETNRSIDEIEDRLLTASAQKIFAEDRFRRQRTVRPVYVLRDGEYVFVDPILRPVLNEIRTLQDASKEERQSFLANPRRVLRERLGEEISEKVDVERRFVETEQFSKRVTGVDIWRTPVLPWIKRVENSWLPERFGFRVGEDYFIVDPEDAEKLRQRVDEAAAAGHDSVDVSGLLQPVLADVEPPKSLPLTPQVQEAVAGIASVAERTRGVADKQPQIKPDEVWTDDRHGAGHPLFLLVRDNLEEVGFLPTADFVPVVNKPEAAVQLPARLHTQLKPHQNAGFNWLVRSYLSGKPGALLADDMGLGKTLQALTFLAWLQDMCGAGGCNKGPCLIVAPTGLLQNWREEIEQHLAVPRLGELILAFGGELKYLKEEGFSGNDVQNGRASLLSQDWSHAGAVLTTYETLRDYHFSFARVPFSAIVFDEIQKLKNPASQLTRAAKTLNSRFVLGMTGTPVENRLQDLWSIMDVVSPGLLGSSKDFERRYPVDVPEKLTALKQLLTEDKACSVPIMLRRMKADHLPGLPEKHTHAKVLKMPQVQADAYGQLVRTAIASRDYLSRRNGMLPLLHAMRGVSLHPIDPTQAPQDLNAYAQDSARLSWTLEILESVAEAHEKALIFVESLAMQEKLATMIQSRWQLASAPMRINGSVAGDKRQQLVHRFQEHPGIFDVMILSPKAGGVGLNLTAANHVIHLSRWWNPAVEDQCTDRCFRIGQSKSVHVYLPMAAHPDPEIGPSSFDLKLNDLLERKRQLSRDMLAPMDGDDSDIAELFDAVSRVAPPTQEPVHAAVEPGSDAEPVMTALAAETQEPAKRPKISLPQPSQPVPNVRVFTARKGQLRPLENVTTLLKGKHIRHVRISDPYALVNGVSRAAQVKFLASLARHAHALEAVTFEFDPETGEQLERDQIHDMRSKLALAFSQRHQPKTVFSTKRKGRASGDDFHDREVHIECVGAGGAAQMHTIWTGRGLVSLVEPGWDLRLTYQAPSP